MIRTSASPGPLQGPVSGSAQRDRLSCLVVDVPGERLVRTVVGRHVGAVLAAVASAEAGVGQAEVLDRAGAVAVDGGRAASKDVVLDQDVLVTGRVRDDRRRTEDPRLTGA